ncbi:hypothetical protein ACW5W4_01120 [Aeromonas crassostreae]
MERQTLHEHPPVYHVCQQCAGQGCSACSDLCILDGDLDELGPDFTDIDLADWVDETGALSCESQSPINGVIGVKPLFAYRLTCPFCGEFLSGDGYTQVLHCPDTQSDYDSFEPDASPVYCYQVEA